MDFVLHGGQSVLAIEVKPGKTAHPGAARPLGELLGMERVAGIARKARRVGLVITRGREIEPLAPHVWAIPDWRLFGPAV